MRIRVGHLYPDYLNIYADRGNIAVLTRRASLRGHDLLVEPIGLAEPLDPDAYDLLYVGVSRAVSELVVISPASVADRLGLGG